MHCLSQISLDAELLAVGGKRTEQDQQVTDRSRAVSIEVRWTRVRCGQFTGTVINEGIHVVIRRRFVCTTEAIISTVSIVEQRRCEVVAGRSIGTTERRAVGTTRGSVVDPAVLPIVSIVVVQVGLNQFQGSATAVRACSEDVAQHADFL